MLGKFNCKAHTLMNSLRFLCLAMCQSVASEGSLGPALLTALTRNWYSSRSTRSSTFIVSSSPGVCSETRRWQDFRHFLNLAVYRSSLGKLFRSVLKLKLEKKRQNRDEQSLTSPTFSQSPDFLFRFSTMYFSILAPLSLLGARHLRSTDLLS